MQKRWQFHVPTQVRFGRGGLKRLGETAKEFGTSAMLVGYRDQTGLEKTYDRATRSLADAGVAVTEFLEIPPDPEAELAVEGARRASEAGVDVVVGLGGGSPIDAAKGIAALVKMGGNLWDYAGANEQFRPITDSLPLVAVPTTSGTGTEVTAVAVFNHSGVGSTAEYPLKASIAGPAVLPNVALVDPELTVGSPPGLTAACGADALGHALEACMSRQANPLSTALAGRAISLIVKHLPATVENPDDPDLRESLALASTLAGVAFANSSVTTPHTMAHALGALLHVPHGQAVAIATPLNLRFNAEVCRDVYCHIAHYCGIIDKDPEQQAARFIDRITELLREVGLPDRVEVPAGAPADLASRLAANAMESTLKPLLWNPREVTKDQLTRLFEEIL
ncbi:MAG: iron-containing alcohol dehydrogenase [Candidatus Nealsonbacteria bacterium]|nr:iron-containing alcohol dehydrogenase [Candidatus Nealsonbacteria bacterium]